MMMFMWLVLTKIPNVDGYVFINTDENLLSGDMVKVKIESAYEYDLMGSLVHE